IAVIIAPATDEFGDLELVVINFAERKKVCFADFERKFTDRITKDEGEIRLYELQRINAEAIDIPFCYGVLIAADQGGANLRSGANQSLQCLEIAAVFSALAFPPDRQIGSNLVGPDGCFRCEPRIAGLRRFRPFGNRPTVGPAPANLVTAVTP